MPGGACSGGVSAGDRVRSRAEREELWFEVAARSTVVFTVTMENAEGQGRHEHTAWVRNAAAAPQEMTWVVPAYAREMDMRIVRVEFHSE